MTDSQFLLCLILGIVQSILCLLSIIIGILINKYLYYSGTPSNIRTQNTHKFNNKNKSIDIDETKVVLNIDTNKLEKKFNNIAESTSIEDSTLNSSISKLKQMKG